MIPAPCQPETVPLHSNLYLIIEHQRSNSIFQPPLDNLGHSDLSDTQTLWPLRYSGLSGTPTPQAHRPLRHSSLSTLSDLLTMSDLLTTLTTKATLATLAS